jgi:pseudaminic acid biosynthesis-associated methylase
LRGGGMGKPNRQLEKWTGGFGREYTERNRSSLTTMERLYKRNFGVTRTEMNRQFLDGLDRSMRILEVGCNIGNQLLCLQRMGFDNLYGIEPQDYAVEVAKKRTKGIHIIKGDIFDIAFKDHYFDLVFTSGVLIHISPKNIKKALKEIYRSSRKYIWGYEYYSEKYEEIPYRGKKNLLWRGNFVEIYKSLAPNIRIAKLRLLRYLDNNNMDIMFLLKK